MQSRLFREIENDKNFCKIWLEAIWEFPKFPKVRIIIILSFYTKLIKLKALSLKNQVFGIIIATKIKIRCISLLDNFSNTIHNFSVNIERRIQEIVFALSERMFAIYCSDCENIIIINLYKLFSFQFELSDIIYRQV